MTHPSTLKGLRVAIDVDEVVIGPAALDDRARK